MRLGVVAMALVVTLGSAASAGERVDFFDLKGRRTGSAIVDRETGRVDFYDTKSRRTGWGRWEPQTGRLERFGLDGRRQDAEAPPLPGRNPKDGRR